MAKSLVLVVGAGASSEVGLPIGTDLRNAIAQDLNSPSEYGQIKFQGDDRIHSALCSLAGSPQPLDRVKYHLLLNAAHRITIAMPQAISIDNFIDSHRGDEAIAQCGKLAIIHCILAAERKSRLFVDPDNIYNRIRFQSLQGTWFNAFFQLLTENCQREGLEERFNKIAIVCFNYDRCIEHFLHSALQNYYGLPESEATRVLSALEIYHPYGSVGPLPWHDSPKGISFGGIPNAMSLVELAKGIRTFTEGVDPGLSDIKRIRDSIATARRLAFLGFAYHRLNLQLLFADFPLLGADQRCCVYGTAFGISRSDIRQISSELSGLGTFPGEHFLHSDLKCSELFREYWKSLALD